MRWNQWFICSLLALMQRRYGIWHRQLQSSTQIVSHPQALTLNSSEESHLSHRWDQARYAFGLDLLEPMDLQESIDLPKRTFTLVEPITKATKETREWTQTQDPPPKLQIVRPSINQDPNLDSDQVCMNTDAAWNPQMEYAGLGQIIDDAGSSSSHSATSSI